jgi:hypothetical protein
MGFQNLPRASCAIHATEGEVWVGQQFHLLEAATLTEHSREMLCPLLRKVFSEQLKCFSPLTTFTSPPLVSARFASTSSLHYHSLLPSLGDLVAYVQQKICSHSDVSCIHSASLLNIADSLDLDYDAISHALTFTAYWSRPPPVLFDPITSKTYYDSWTIAVDAHAEKVEVGVLSTEAAPDASELQLSGFLTVVGEDKAPSPTLFSFPSRHHLLPARQSSSQSYSVSFQSPTGLHPTMQISFPSRENLSPPNTKPEESVCALHTYLTLPSTIFADKYQLSSSDEIFLESHNLRAMRSIAGETNLEAPDYIVPKWGSSVLLELAAPLSSAKGADGPWNVTIPLHLRYMEPTVGGTSPIQIPWPIVFWACTADEGTKFPVNPFDRVNLGYDSLFGPRTMFYHLDAQGQNGVMVEELDAPVLDTEAVGSTWVESGTVLVVMLGFAWVLWKLWPAAKTGIGGSKSDETVIGKGKKVQ